jgi:hypothetical protein
MQFNEPDEEQAGISLTSLIDVMFLLLIFFMLTSSFVKFHRKLDLQLPEAKAADLVLKERKPIQIEMDRGNRITMDGQEVTLTELGATEGSSGKAHLCRRPRRPSARPREGHGRSGPLPRCRDSGDRHRSQIIAMTDVRYPWADVR